MSKHYMFRAGHRGAATVLALYGWDGSGTPALVGDTYDGRNGKAGSYIPINYTRHARLALSYFASNGRLVIYFPQRLVDAGSANGPLYRWLWTHAPTDTGPALTTCPTNAGIQSEWIAAVYCTATTYYALTVGPPPRIWTSTDGRLWTQGSALSGSPPGFENGSAYQVFEFAGGLYAFGAFGLFSLSADLLTWTPIPLLDSGTYNQMSYRGVAADATAIVVLCKGLQASDNKQHNILLRSTNGTSFASVRDVEQDIDWVTGINQGVEWEHIVAFGTGFLVYGKDAMTGAYPKVLTSTNHGSTWDAGANLTPWVYPVENCTGYPGANRVVASIALDLADGPYEVLHKSSDGVTFTPLTF